MQSPGIMIVNVFGTRCSRINVLINTITLPLTSSSCFISLMVLPSLMLLTHIHLFQVVSASFFVSFFGELRWTTRNSFVYRCPWRFFHYACLPWIPWCADVPEGSFIIRAHTPMSNLFSCLWFNEVDRFTSRDQLSFAYTYLKLKRMNPDRPFFLYMFKVKNFSVWCMQ